MLANILALAVGLGSIALYMAAFFFPEVHRKNDFLWSGVGLFYALVLWCCARQITGAVLLGQVACVSLLGWLGWQMVMLRRSLTPTDLQTPVSVESFNQSTTETFAQIKTNLRNGSWLKAIPKLAVSFRESLQDGFSDSSENRLSRLAKARPISKRKLKRRYEYEFVEDTPRDRRVQAAVRPSPQKEPPDGATTMPETMDMPEALIAPEPTVESTVCSSPEKDAPDRTTARPEAMNISGEPVASEPTAVLPETTTPVEISNIEESTSDGSIRDDSMTAEVPQPASTAAESSGQNFANQALEKAGIIKDWMQELIASLTRPKPKYTMIELPPRPPSIPRPTAELRGVAADELVAELEELDNIEKNELAPIDQSGPWLDESLSAEIIDDVEDPEAVSEVDLGTESEAIETLMIVDSDRILEADVDTELSSDSTTELSGDSTSDEPGDVVNHISP